MLAPPRVYTDENSFPGMHANEKGKCIPFRTAEEHTHSEFQTQTTKFPSNKNSRICPQAQIVRRKQRRDTAFAFRLVL